MRRFLLHVLPSGFHRIRHYGLLANAGRTRDLATARSLLQPTPHLRAEAQARSRRPGRTRPAHLRLPVTVARR